MKIAVVHNLPAGGQKRALFHQVQLLSKNHTIDLFTAESANESYLPLAPFVQNHISVPFIYPPHFPKSIFSIYFMLPRVYKKIADMINAGDFDICLVHPDFLTQAPYILRYLHIPSLYWCPEPKREFYEYHPRKSNRFSYYGTLAFRLPLRGIDKANAQCATRVLTNSAYSKERIDTIYGISSSVNYLGVDLQQFYKIPRLKDDAVLSVGEFSAHKGYEFIIRSLSLIPPKIRPSYMIVGHGGREKKYLYHFARSHKVRIALYEGVSERELLDFYNRAKACVYAAFQEPFGLVLLEAAACGVPIVAVAEGGIGEILASGEFGIGTARNEEEYAHALQKILGGRYRIRYTANRNTLLEKWSWKKSVGELEHHLEEIAR